MQLKEFDIILDIKKYNKIDYFEVVQGDLNSNVLNITLVDGLNPYDLSGANVEIVFAKPDGTTVIQDNSNGVVIIDELEGKIQCTLNTNTIASPGQVNAEVRVLKGGEILLTSARFDFYVRKPLITDDTIESTNEFPILNLLITITEGLIQQVEQIEKQVPENVVDELNNLSVLAGQLQSELSDLEADVNSHKAENMPHQFINHKENKTYKFGFQVSVDGKPQIIYEEVV